MLTGIGLIIILKQIPHALGYDLDYEGDVAFRIGDENTFSMLQSAFEAISAGALMVSILSLAILVLWESVLTKKHTMFRWIQGPLVAVAAGILLTNLFNSGTLPFTLSEDRLVNIPVADSLPDFFKQFSLPDFSQLSNPTVYATAVLLAIIASLETLLCVEATDKLDPNKSITPANRELKAQGIGNIVSGFIGGLPITQVIVRSTANITFGARTKLSTIFHGVLLLVTAISIPRLLNQVPLATLACILFIVGYKLAKPSLFAAMYRLGWDQFTPFISTVIGIVFTDLLKGIGIGIVVAIFYLLRNHYKNAYSLVHLPEKSNGRPAYVMELAEEVTFLNKGSILKTLNTLTEGCSVTIDAAKSKIIDHDVLEVIRDFTVNANKRNIQVQVTNIPNIETANRFQVITEGVRK
jgi:MFS superfamily sulfate permease-like transporter